MSVALTALRRESGELSSKSSATGAMLFSDSEVRGRPQRGKSTMDDVLSNLRMIRPTDSRDGGFLPNCRRKS